MNNNKRGITTKMNVFINNKNEIYKMRDRLLAYLQEEWGIGYNPNLDRVKYDLNVCDLRSSSLFYDSLDWLVEYEFALIKIYENGVERIVIHPIFELKTFILDSQSTNIGPVE